MEGTWHLIYSPGPCSSLRGAHYSFLHIVSCQCNVSICVMICSHLFKMLEKCVMGAFSEESIWPSLCEAHIISLRCDSF